MNQSVSFFERLRDSRLKLGLNQTDFAQIGGVTKKTQMLYESGERAPDSSYLTAIAAAGADVLYILTGTRTATHTALSQVRTATELASKLGGSTQDKAALAEAAFHQLQQPLPADEQMWLDCYREWDSPVKKRELRRAMGVLSEGGVESAQVAPAGPVGGAYSQHNSGANSVQIGGYGGKVTIKKGR